LIWAVTDTVGSGPILILSQGAISRRRKRPALLETEVPLRFAMLRKATVKSGGFSLLELILVLAIIVTFAAMAAPRYGIASARYRADHAARRVAADLRQAQAHAKATSASCTVSFSTATEKYQLLNVPSFDGGPGDYTVDLAADPYRANLVAAGFGGTGQVIFDGWGLPDNGGTVVVAVGSEQRKIVLDAETGQASVQ
jgi:prepilin-type N-terminal cleavage/methylation domain-containing protein